MTNKELTKSMKEALMNNELETINLSNIELLKGKHIQTLNLGYNGQNNVDGFVVGEVISLYELASREVMDNGCTRAEYWESFLPAEKIQEKKESLTILDDNGRETYIYFDKEYNEDGDFHRGDLGRSVYFRLAQ